MNTILKARGLAWALLLFGTLCLMPSANASPGDFYTSVEVKVVAHMPLNGKPTRQMFLQQEGRKQYLYVRQDSQIGFTTFDVTKPERPRMVNHMPQQDLTMLNSRLGIAETPDSGPAVSSSHLAGRLEGSRGGGSTVPESVRVVDESDPAHPRTVQAFAGVTDFVRDDTRNLIYIANGDGIWILSHQQVLRRHPCSSSAAISSAIPNCD
jgi:hypothetical protein